MNNSVDVKVDWFSFTVPLQSGTRDQSPETIDHMLKTLNFASGGLLTPYLNASSFELQNANGFYVVRLVDRLTGFRLSWGDVNAHIYVEMPGKFCDVLTKMGDIMDIIACHAEKCSRIDIAGDFLTALEPRECIGNAYETGRRAFSQIRSHEGLTVYVGSRKSDRFMRIYRYSPPHPRAHLLRFEHENKGQVSKTVCRSVLESGLQDVFSSLQNSYTWDVVEIQQLSTSTGKIPSNRGRTDEVATTIWLYQTVAAALARAASEGTIDLDEFIENEVRPKIIPLK